MEEILSTHTQGSLYWTNYGNGWKHLHAYNGHEHTTHTLHAHTYMLMQPLVLSVRSCGFVTRGLEGFRGRQLVVLQGAELSRAEPSWAERGGQRFWRVSVYPWKHPQRDPHPQRPRGEMRNKMFWGWKNTGGWRAGRATRWICDGCVCDDYRHHHHHNNPTRLEVMCLQMKFRDWCEGNTGKQQEVSYCSVWHGRINAGQPFFGGASSRKRNNNCHQHDVWINMYQKYCIVYNTNR